MAFSERSSRRLILPIKPSVWNDATSEKVERRCRFAPHSTPHFLDAVRVENDIGAESFHHKSGSSRTATARNDGVPQSGTESGQVIEFLQCSPSKLRVWPI